MTLKVWTVMSGNVLAMKKENHPLMPKKIDPLVSYLWMYREGALHV